MDHERSSSDEPPAKKQRVLACRRCRNRKQKCEGSRPCTNCVKSGDECIPTAPAPRSNSEPEYVRALEERIAELEARDPHQSQDHLVANSILVNGNGNGNGGQTPPPPLRRLTQSSAQSANGRPVLTHHEAAGQRRRSEAVDFSASGGDAHSLSPVNQSQARRTHIHRSPGDAFSLTGDDDSDEDLGHFIYGLVTSPSVRDDGHNAPGKSPGFPATSFREGDFLPQVFIAAMPQEAEDMLLGAYRGRIQATYPFLHWDTFLSWLEDWKCCSPADREAQSWQGFFANLVYSTALLVLALPRIGTDARTFYKNGASLLPHVFRQHSPILHAQAYLLLSAHALHRSSTPRILSIVSTSMRYCIQNQFHLDEAEPVPTTPDIRLQNQLRRRCFWSAYCLDRMIVASFELPPSISDLMITTKLYSNISDEDLEAIAAQTPAENELPDSPTYTCVSSALHILQCRRIQSEISGYTLRWDYKERYEQATEWRIRILSELETYKSRVQNFSDPLSKGHTSHRWLAMIYHYTLLTLYRPTKETVLGAAGDWSIQASSQASLAFRKSQMDRQIAQGWVGLLVQFQSGVTLLYCCWATPPEYRTESYDSPDVSDALRACSNILAIMTDRWPRADCLRDVFELLAREIPLVDRPSRPPTRISEASATAIREKLPQVKRLVVHRPIMRMIEEIITEDFPRLRGNDQPPPQIISRRATPSIARRDQQTLTTNRQLLNASPTPVSFELPFAPGQMYVGDETGVETAGMSTDELIAFPGIFDLDSWA
uniref:Zn(2)-C6 fungal-type domain-containing protein n=1 Tax=Bionectria ochroleuca TaxID=29856 RepID=A0A8H7KEM6_BIOOC